LLFQLEIKCINVCFINYIINQHYLFRGKTMAVNPSDPDLMTREEDISRASRSLKAMSHPLRLKILCTLGDKEVSVQDIVDAVGTSQSNISQHLAILRDKGILASRKDANKVFYRVGDTRTLRLIGMMQDVFCSAGR
jgi:ArsR family transcriptional regulator